MADGKNLFNIEAETKKFYKEFLHYDLRDKEVGSILNRLRFRR